MPNAKKSTWLHRLYFQDGPLEGQFVQAYKTSYKDVWNYSTTLKIVKHDSYSTPTLSSNAIYVNKKIEKTNSQYKLQSITHAGRVVPNKYTHGSFQPIGTYVKTYIYVWTAAPDGIADEVAPDEVQDFPEYTKLDKTALEHAATEAMDMPSTFAEFNWSPYKEYKSYEEMKKHLKKDKA